MKLHPLLLRFAAIGAVAASILVPIALVEGKIAERRMRAESVLQVVGMADRGPLDAKDPLAGVNRRIELLILTSAQSRAVSSMFGTPAKATSLNEDVSVSMPDEAALEELRKQLPK